MTPTITFNTCIPQDLRNYIEEFIITNHNNEIIAVQHNNIESGLLDYILASYQNYNKATVRTTAANYAPTCNECILIFRSAATGTITLMENRWNEWVIHNETSVAKQLIGAITSYFNPNGVLTNFIPANSVVRLAKGKDNNWYQINNLKGSGTSGVLAGVVSTAGMPVGGQTTYQNDKLIGLGAANDGNIQIKIAETIMSNYGSNASFTLDNVGGIISLLFGNTFIAGTSFYCDLNQ